MYTCGEGEGGGRRKWNGRGGGGRKKRWWREEVWGQRECEGKMVKDGV